MDYHLDHARQWVLRLGDGTDESHARIQAALDDEWPYLAELFDGRGSTPPCSTTAWPSTPPACTRPRWPGSSRS